jgi:hypothetical protein
MAAAGRQGVDRQKDTVWIGKFAAKVLYRRLRRSPIRSDTKERAPDDFNTF